MNRQNLSDHLERQERASRGRRVKTPASPVRRRRSQSAASTTSESPPAVPAKMSLLERIPWVAILALLLLIMAMLLVKYLQNTVQQREERRLAEEQRIQTLVEPEFCELRYLVPNQPDLVEKVSYGETAFLHAPVELDGYTFLGWEDADGVLESRSSFPVLKNTWYTARYALPLETEEHLPYLKADENGVVDVDGVVSRREFVNVLYLLLNIDRIGSAEFVDVEEDDSCFKAAATLKELGILQGNYLYPDDKLTGLELLQVLERFYPAVNAPAIDFPDLDSGGEAYDVYCTAAAYGWISPEDYPVPTEPVTRGEFAHTVNRVLGRSFPQNGRSSLVGTILDVPPSHRYYADISEAVIPHQYETSDSGEIWTKSKPLPPHEPGLFFAGVRMHYINEDGSPALNTVVDGRRFNANGELTTGDADLDRELWAVLEELIDPEAMEGEEMLQKVYDYICDNYAPDVDTLYELGAEGWALKEAKRFFAAGRGSSYGYSGLFYELSYLIGYEPILCSGVIYGKQTVFEAEDGTRIEAPKGYTPHGWVELKFDGISYIFDPSMESRVDSYRIFFKKNNPIRWQYGYRMAVW